MELKQIKELMAAMGRSGTQRLLLKKEGFELSIERGEESVTKGAQFESAAEESPMLQDIEEHRVSASVARSLESKQGRPSEEKKEEVKPGSFITSPMVGTFYMGTSPEEPPFVKVGDVVEEDTIVCIVEAMKVMNEVKAGTKGVVEEILMEDNHPVEFGTNLFRISFTG